MVAEWQVLKSSHPVELWSGIVVVMCSCMATGLERMDGNDQWRTLASSMGVTVYQRSKTVWIATGKYRGHDFEVKARSPKLALALWKEAARYAGSDW